jgi:hypothetical protein
MMGDHEVNMSTSSPLRPHDEVLASRLKEISLLDWFPHKMGDLVQVSLRPGENGPLVVLDYSDAPHRDHEGWHVAQTTRREVPLSCFTASLASLQKRDERDRAVG